MTYRQTYPGTQAAGDVLTSANFSRLPGGWTGYAEVTAAQTGITTVTDLTSLSVTIGVGTGRRIRITGHAEVTRTVADGLTVGRIAEGATQLGCWCVSFEGSYDLAEGSVVIAPTAGTHTYKLTLERSSGTGTVGISAGTTDPAFILVEDIGPA